MNYLRHFFSPHNTNNYRAKILHNSSLFIIFFALILISSGIFFIKKSKPDVLGISYSISTRELLDETNKMRVENGKEPLVLNDKLSEAAKNKANYMFEKHFWAHFAPDGTTPWSFIKSSHYDYVYAGENLAKGYVNSKDVVNAWMNSPSHRENLLSSKYKDIGFAVKDGYLTDEDTVLVVQMFASPYSSTQEVSSSLDNGQNSYEEVKTSEKVLPINEAVKNPAVNIKGATHSLSIVILIFIITVLILDIIIVERKKIPRIVGHNLDHLIILILLLVFIILQKTGGIL